MIKKINFKKMKDIYKSNWKDLKKKKKFWKKKKIKK